MASQNMFEGDQTATRDLANQWLARFAPLISSDEIPFEAAIIRSQLATIASLRADAPELRRYLEPLTQEPDQRLHDTINQAIGQLDSIEDGLRKQLAKVAPGDPEGMIDMSSLQDRLAERQAKQEIGVQQTDLIPSTLELETSPPNKAVAISAGVFGIGWTAFTTFHCVFMIGGMYKAFGFAAFGLLAFYAIFFSVGFMLLSSAINSLCSESISLNGRHLSIRRKLGNWLRTKTYELSTSTQASVGKAQPGTSGISSSSAPLQTINLTDTRGKGISFGASTTYEFKTAIAKKINEYLAAWG
jgi:hypothetical protein